MPSRLRSTSRGNRNSYQSPYEYQKQSYARLTSCAEMEQCRYCGRTGIQCPSVRPCHCAEVPKPMCDPRNTHPPCLSCVKYSLDSYMNLHGWESDPPLNPNKQRRWSRTKLPAIEDKKKFEPIIPSQPKIPQQPFVCKYLFVQPANDKAMQKPPGLEKRGYQNIRYKWLVMIFVALVALPLLQHIMWKAHMKPISEDSRLVNLYLMTGVLFINIFLVINVIRTFDARHARQHQIY